jgi:DNA-binding NtrC family response regulator
LSRALEERESPRGERGPMVPVDVRLICTRRERADDTAALRPELTARGRSLLIELPPRRQRRSDIPALVRHFRSRIEDESGVALPQLDGALLSRLATSDWPGNVRQLENTVERALAFSQGRSGIDVQDLPPEIQNHAGTIEGVEGWLPEDGLDFERYIEGIELSLIKRSLERTRGNKVQAARLLNLKRTTLIEKLKRLEPSQASE